MQCRSGGNLITPDLETLTSPITLARFLTLGGCFKICKTITRVLVAIMRNNKDHNKDHKDNKDHNSGPPIMRNDKDV